MSPVFVKSFVKYNKTVTEIYSWNAMKKDASGIDYNIFEYDEDGVAFKLFLCQWKESWINASVEPRLYLINSFQAITIFKITKEFKRQNLVEFWHNPSLEGVNM